MIPFSVHEVLGSWIAGEGGGSILGGDKILGAFDRFDGEDAFMMASFIMPSIIDLFMPSATWWWSPPAFDGDAAFQDLRSAFGGGGGRGLAAATALGGAFVVTIDGTL